MEADNTNEQLVNSFCIDGRHQHTHPHTHTCLHTLARTYTIHPVPSGVGSTSLSLSRHLDQSSPYMAIFSHSRLFTSAFMLVFFFPFCHPLLSSMLSFNVITLAARIHEFTKKTCQQINSMCTCNLLLCNRSLYSSYELLQLTLYQG